MSDPTTLLAGPRAPGHNRPKAGSDWFSQIVCGLVVLGAIAIWGGSSNVVPLVIIPVIAIPYIILIEWLAHLEDRRKANRIWAIVWAVFAILEVRAHNRRVQERAQMAAQRAARPPVPPASRNGLDYGDR
jgi:hypothetical protein